MTEGVLADNDLLRRSIYAGELRKFAAGKFSRRLTELAHEEVQKAFGDDYRKAQFNIPADEFFQKSLAVKKQVFESEEIQEAAFALITSLGFSETENVMDPPRVRFIEHEGHRSAAAAVAYLAHRDTWYANPQSQINWWIPLHDVSEQETFGFYPSLFNAAVENTSGNFDFDEFITQVGFGRSHQSKVDAYPVPLRALDGERFETFGLPQSGLLLFSAAHLHRTIPNTSGMTRISIDFRTVHVGDNELGLGAPNADNYSTGSSLPTYKRRAATHAR